MYSLGNPAIPQRIAPIPQRIFAARPALAPPRLLPCIDAGKLPDGRRVDPVQHFLFLPLKRRLG